MALGYYELKARVADSTKYYIYFCSVSLRFSRIIETETKDKQVPNKTKQSAQEM